MDDKALIITKKAGTARRVARIRIPADLYGDISLLMEQSNRSRNDIITLLLKYAVKHAVIVDESKLVQ